MKKNVNDKIEKCLVDGAITTLIKQNIDLNLENISILISKGLNRIIINGKYNDFTSLNDSRKKIQNYSRMDYINFILNKVAFNFGGIDEVISSLNIIKRNNSYEFDKYKMSEYIAFYIDNIFKIDTTNMTEADTAIKLSNGIIDGMTKKLINKNM